MKKLITAMLLGMALCGLPAQGHKAKLLACTAKLGTHEEAYEAFRPYQPIIRVTTSTYYIGNTAYTRYHYDSNDRTVPEGEWRLALFNYKEAISKLRTAYALKAGGDGFLQGALAAASTPFLTKKFFHLRILGISALAALAFIGYDNNQQEVTPYYEDESLRHHNDLFTNKSLYTTGRMSLAVLGNVCGYFGASYALARLAKKI